MKKLFNMMKHHVIWTIFIIYILVVCVFAVGGGVYSSPSSSSTVAVNKVTVKPEHFKTFIPPKSSVTEEEPPAIKEAPPAQVEKIETIVYITATGKKYHRAGCRYLSRSEIAINLDDAISEGYTPCSVCNPPTEDEATVSPNIEQETPTVESVKTIAQNYLYPDLIEKTEDTTDLGMTLKSEDQKVSLEILLYEGDNLIGDISKMYEDDCKFNEGFNGIDQFYSKKGTNWYTIAFYNNNETTYTKKIMGQTTGYRIQFVYPTNQKEKYSKFVERFSENFDAEQNIN